MSEEQYSETHCKHQSIKTKNTKKYQQFCYGSDKLILKEHASHENNSTGECLSQGRIIKQDRSLKN